MAPDIENHIRHNGLFTTASPCAQLQTDGRGKCSKAVPPRSTWPVNLRVHQNLWAPFLCGTDCRHSAWSAVLVSSTFTPARGIRTETTTSFFCRVAARTCRLTSHTSVKFRKRATLKKLSEAEDLVVRQRFACSLTSAISGAWLGATTRLTGGGRGGPWTGPPVGMVQCLSSLKMVARRAVPLDALSFSSSYSYGN